MIHKPRKNLINSDGIAIAGLIFLFSVFFAHLFFPVSRLFVTPDFGLSEFWQYTYPVKYVLAQALKNGEIPLWRSDIASGYPLFAEAQIGFFYLYNQIVFRFLYFIQAINIGYVVTFCIAGIGTYVFARINGLTAPFAFFSGMTFGFSGVMITQISHYNVLQSISIMPWVMVLTHMLFTKPSVKRGLMLAIVLSQQYFVGFPQISFITLCGIGIYYLFYARKKRFVKDILVFVGIGLVALLLSAVQLFPSRELFAQSVRKRTLPYKTATFFSYPLKHFVTLLNPYALGNPKDASYPDFTEFSGSVFWENTGYIGILALLLALIGIYSMRKNRFALFLFLLMITSGILMTGKYSPLYFIYTIPPFNLFRVPSRFLMLFVWALSLLAGYGLSRLYSLLSRRSKIFAVIFFSIIVIISFIDQFKFGYFYHPTVPMSAWMRAPETTSVMSIDERYISIGVSSAWNKIFTSTGWKNPDRYRTLFPGLEPNVNMLYGVRAFDMYPILPTVRQNLISNLVHNSINNTEKATIDRAANNILASYNIGYIVSTDQIRNEEGLLPALARNSRNSSVAVYKIDSLPYARVVYDFRKAETLEDFESIIKSESFDPQKTVVVEDDIPLIAHKAYKSANVKTQLFTNQKKTFFVTTKHAGLFTVAESYYPGWKASIDGKQTKIYAVNINSQGIVVPAGDHIIRFSYEPSSFVKGAYISGAAHIIVLLALFGGFVSRAQTWLSRSWHQYHQKSIPARFS